MAKVAPKTAVKKAASKKLIKKGSKVLTKKSSKIAKKPVGSRAAAKNGGPRKR